MADPAAPDGSLSKEDYANQAYDHLDRDHNSSHPCRRSLSFLATVLSLRFRARDRRYITAAFLAGHVSDSITHERCENRRAANVARYHLFNC
jgi:hypothetical protein